MDALLAGAHAVRRQHHLPHPVPDDQHRARLGPAVLPPALADDATSSGWLDAYRFWTKVFALSFALGVVSGITMSFQFGTNWPGYMERVGNIAGPLLGYEVLTAFFLEAGFLGIMLFGHGKVSERVHLLATFLVAFGTTLCAFWILAPQLVDADAGRLRDRSPAASTTPTSWLAVIFNPSFPYRLAHMLLASALTVRVPARRPVGAGSCCAASRARSAPRVLRVGLTLAAVADPAADRRRRPARPEHAGAPAAEDRGDGRRLGNRARRAAACCSRCPTRRAAATTSRSPCPRLASLILTHEPTARSRA